MLHLQEFIFIHFNNKEDYCTRKCRKRNIFNPDKKNICQDSCSKQHFGFSSDKKLTTKIQISPWIKNNFLCHTDVFVCQNSVFYTTAHHGWKYWPHYAYLKENETLFSTKSLYGGHNHGLTFYGWPQTWCLFSQLHFWKMS